MHSPLTFTQLAAGGQLAVLLDSNTAQVPKPLLIVTFHFWDTQVMVTLVSVQWAAPTQPHEVPSFGDRGRLAFSKRVQSQLRNGTAQLPVIPVMRTV